jgi:hypothetical protein
MDDITRELAEAVEEFESAKVAEKAATERRQDAQDRVAVLMETLGKKTRTLDLGDRRLRVTRSTSDYVAGVDERGLKKALGAKVWRTVTDVKLSQPKLKAAIEAGTVDALVAARFLEIKQKKPTITVTAVSEED